jgi:hypothetical protein
MSPEKHNEIVSGIVFGIINFDVHNPGGKAGSGMHPEALMQDLSSIVRDHYTHVIEVLGILLNQCQDMMKESSLR